jgi:hypothetical protein
MQFSTLLIATIAFTSSAMGAAVGVSVSLPILPPISINIKALGKNTVADE